MGVDLDLAYMPATELAGRLRKKELSPVEVVENALARIEEIQEQLNCFCFIYPDEALAEAKAAERRLARDDGAAPLTGVPIAFKDFTPTLGKVTTYGSRVYENWVANFDPVIVRRFKAAGAIMIGKTTTPEFAFTSFTDSPLWGITRNPWNPDRTSGGSSGGSAAAVASGCVYLAEGTDMGGSVRIPASCCGIVGLKPSLGRIPMDILPSVFDNISHFGPLARNVADAALFLSVAQGSDNSDIQSLPAIDLEMPPRGDLKGRRFALSVDLGYYAVDLEVETALRQAAQRLVDAGASVEEIELGWTRAVNDAWSDTWAVYQAAAFGHLLGEKRDLLDPRVARLMERGLRIDAVAYKRIEGLRTRQWRDMARIFKRFDALICPTLALPPQPAERSDADYDKSDAAGRYHGFDMTLPFNFVAPCPVISLTCGFTRDGLPVGMQIVVDRHRDDLALSLAAAYEAIEPRSGLRPPL